MRVARVDLFQQLSCLSLVYKNRQSSDVAFLSRQHFKFFLLAGSFFGGPSARRFTRDRFDSANTRGNRFFLYDPKWSDLTCRSYMCAATKLHRVTIERSRRSTDLQDAHRFAVFLAKKLLNVGTFFCLGVRNFCPGNWRILRDSVVN